MKACAECPAVMCGATAVSPHPAESIVLTCLALDLGWARRKPGWVPAVWFTCAVTVSDGGLAVAHQLTMLITEFLRD
jgi:hypothetical protein